MITIVIPVYNEEKRVKENLKIILSFIEKEKREFEVIIIDDGSTDSTPKLLAESKKDFPIKIVTHEINLGKGAAIKTGVNEAAGDLIIFTDIDLSVPIDFIKMYLKVLDDKTDIVIGSRNQPGAKVLIKQSFLREMLGESFIHLSNFILGVGVSDFTCGFKLFRKKAALTIFNKLLINRWAFDAEALFLAKKYHFKIREVPVIWEHREGSKVKFPKDLIETLFSLFQIRLNNFLGKYDS